MIEHMKEQENITNHFEELNTILDTLKMTLDVKAETIKIRKVCKDEERCGLLDSEATSIIR